MRSAICCPAELLRSEVRLHATELRDAVRRGGHVPIDVWMHVVAFASRVVDPDLASRLLRRARRPIRCRLPLLSGRAGDHVLITGRPGADSLRAVVRTAGCHVCLRDRRVDRILVHVVRTLECGAGMPTVQTWVSRRGGRALSSRGLRRMLVQAAEGWISSPHRHALVPASRT